MPDWLGKKLLVLLATALTVILNRKLGLGLDSADLTTISVASGGYLAGQGLADLGKSKAKIEAAARKG